MIILIHITAVSDNMPPAMSKMSLNFGFFCNVNHYLIARRFLRGDLLRKRRLLQRGSKGHVQIFVIGGFRSVLCVSVFQSTLPLNFRVFQKRSKFSRSVVVIVVLQAKRLFVDDVFFFRSFGLLSTQRSRQPV